jgi:hypothetical protein
MKDISLHLNAIYNILAEKNQHPPSSELVKLENDYTGKLVSLFCMLDPKDERLKVAIVLIRAVLKDFYELKDYDMNKKDNPAYSDIISDGGMDPRHEYEQERAKKTEKPVDRFDLEEQIMDCWSIIDDLKLISDSEENKAIITLYQLKFERLWETFETLIEDGNIQ